MMAHETIYEKSQLSEFLQKIYENKSDTYLINKNHFVVKFENFKYYRTMKRQNCVH